MQLDERKDPVHLHLAKLLYIFAVALLFCLLYLSRADEIYTVWETMHPMFLPMFIATTLLLLTIIFTTEKTEYKLLFIILHSILSHSFFVIMFPAGSLGVQQAVLGQTRLVFDNIIHHGFGWTREGLPLQIYVSLRGESLQTAFSVIFARMLCVDVYWSHLLLVPLLWGTFVPVVTFMVSKTLGVKENISVFSSLMVSAFPANISWGAASIPNGLSYLFFFCFVYFLLKYLKSDRRKNLFLVAIFFSASFLSHYLAGTVALSLLLLANSVRTYRKEKRSSLVSARFMLLLSFTFCASIMPFTLVYRRFFYPTANTYFSLQKLYEGSFAEMLSSLLLGSYFDLISREAYMTTLVFGIATLLGLIGIIYILGTSVKKPPKRSVKPSILFLFLGLLMIIVDDRIVKFFMMNTPFVEIERLWLFRDFMLVPFLALFIGATIQRTCTILDIMSRNVAVFLRKTVAHKFSKPFSFFRQISSHKAVRPAHALTYFTLLTIVSGWITASIYYAYPHWAPLQTTSYELEAAKYIEAITNERYIVICDSWTILAGGMIVGIKNPEAYYFSSVDPHGASLFIEMKKNATNETMIKAMNTNNATTTYFIIEEPRLGLGEYKRIKSQAMQNGLNTLPLPRQVSHYRDEEKLCIFYYKE